MVLGHLRSWPVASFLTGREGLLAGWVGPSADEENATDSPIRSADSQETKTVCLPPPAVPVLDGCVTTSATASGLRGERRPVRSPPVSPVAVPVYFHPLRPKGEPLPSPLPRYHRHAPKAYPRPRIMSTVAPATTRAASVASSKLPPQIPAFRGHRAKRRPPSRVREPTPLCQPPPSALHPYDVDTELPYRRPRRVSSPTLRPPNHRLPLFTSRLTDCDVTNPFDLETEIVLPAASPDADGAFLGPFLLEDEEAPPPPVALETYSYQERPLVHTRLTPRAPPATLYYDPDSERHGYHRDLRRRLAPTQALSTARQHLARKHLTPGRAAALLYTHEVLRNRCLFTLLDPLTAAAFHDRYFGDEDHLGFPGSPRGSFTSLSPATLHLDHDASDYLSYSILDTTDESEVDDDNLDEGFASDVSVCAGFLDGLSFDAEETRDMVPSAPVSLRIPSVSPPRRFPGITSLHLPGSHDPTPDVHASEHTREAAAATLATSPTLSVNDSVATVTVSSPLMVDVYSTCWPVNDPYQPQHPHARGPGGYQADYIKIMGWNPLLPATKPRSQRFNPACWRMMAIENRMIRTKKIIAPLKKRLYLPSRRDRSPAYL